MIVPLSTGIELQFAPDFVKSTLFRSFYNPSLPVKMTGKPVNRLQQPRTLIPQSGVVFGLVYWPCSRSYHLRWLNVTELFPCLSRNPGG